MTFDTDLDDLRIGDKRLSPLAEWELSVRIRARAIELQYLGCSLTGIAAAAADIAMAATGERVVFMVDVQDDDGEVLLAALTDVSAAWQAE